MDTENLNDKRSPLLDIACKLCGAPLHATTIYIGTDGRPLQGGEPIPVNQCVVCGENYPPMPTEQSGKPVFVINTEGRANWYLRKRFLAEQEIALLEAQHEDRMRTLRGNLAALKSRFDPQMEDYTRQRLAEGRDKTKTLKLTYGSASFRTVASKWEIVSDADALITAKIACPDAVIVSEKLDRAALLKHVEQTGEVIPGVKRSEERQSFSIKSGTEKSQAAQHVKGGAD